MTVRRTERGWAGHFICANKCRFRRNTLLEYGKTKIVVSTVGLMEGPDGFERVNSFGYFETHAYHSDPEDTRYHDIDVMRPVSIRGNSGITELDADDLANDMHEAAVDEIIERMEKGEE